MSKTQFSLSVSNGTNSASVSTDDAGDIVRLMQLSGQQGNTFSLNVSQTQSDQGPDTTVSQSSNLNLSTKNPSDIMQALRQVVASAQVAQPQTPQVGVKACGCPADCECGCDNPQQSTMPGMDIEEEAEFDWGARDWKDDQHIVSMKRATKQGTAQEPERLTSPRFGSNPLVQEIHERMMESWNSWIAEDEQFDNEDGVSSPLSADKRQEFDKDPSANEEPTTTGQSSPMTTVVRQKIPR